MNNMTPNVLDAVLFLANQREFEQACPIDPSQVAAMPVSESAALKYDARNERVLLLIENQLKATVQPSTMTIIDRLRALLSPLELITLFRKPQDSELTIDLDKEIEDQIKQDLEDDTTGRDE